jgi:hypothetical protein
MRGSRDRVFKTITAERDVAEARKAIYGMEHLVPTVLRQHLNEPLQTKILFAHMIKEFRFEMIERKECFSYGVDGDNGHV